MQPRPKLRLWQLSLRTQLLVITLVCVGTGVYARWIRPRKLEVLMDEFNTAIDERRYDDVYSLGCEAKRSYPKSAVAELLVEKAKFALQISTNRGPRQNGFFGCSLPDEGPNDDTEFSWVDTEKWKALGDKLRRR
jgi:hypothetical protein